MILSKGNPCSMLFMCVCNFPDSSTYKLIFCPICFIFEGRLFFFLFNVLDDQNTLLVFTLLPKALISPLDVL